MDLASEQFKSLTAMQIAFFKEMIEEMLEFFLGFRCVPGKLYDLVFKASLNRKLSSSLMQIWQVSMGKVNMNLRIYAIKNPSQRINNIQLVVVDLDKSKRYPLNFVCILPRYFRILEKRSSKFAKLFREKSHAVAKNS